MTSPDPQGSVGDSFGGGGVCRNRADAVCPRWALLAASEAVLHPPFATAAILSGRRTVRLRLRLGLVNRLRIVVSFDCAGGSVLGPSALTPHRAVSTGRRRTGILVGCPWFLVLATRQRLTRRTTIRVILLIHQIQKLGVLFHVAGARFHGGDHSAAIIHRPKSVPGQHDECRRRESNPHPLAGTGF